MTKENVEKYLEKYEDWWARHNLTSRISIFIFVIIYVVAVAVILTHPLSAPLAQVILETTSYTAFLSVMIVILGPNTFVKIAEFYTNKKFKDLTNKLNTNVTKSNPNQRIEKTPKLPKEEL